MILAVFQVAQLSPTEKHTLNSVLASATMAISFVKKGFQNCEDTRYPITLKTSGVVLGSFNDDLNAIPTMSRFQG